MVTVGCLLLPFVWAVNAVWFFREAFIKPQYEEQKEIKKCKFTHLNLFFFLSWNTTTAQ